MTGFSAGRTRECSSSSGGRARQRYAELVGLDWSFVSVDDCMIKAPLGGEKNRAQSDRPRQVRHQVGLATDAAGVPLAVVVAGANCNDHKLLGPTLAGAERVRPGSRRLHGLCLDKGYDYPVTRWLAAAYRYRLHLRRRGEDRPRCRWKPRRWVVERTHSWFHRARRLLVRWEKKAANYLAFLHLACAFTTLSASSLAG